jgi:hypothetical protein
MWLRGKSAWAPHTFMIDCSATEALAIKLAFTNSPVNILYCYWHLWEAWDENIKKKVFINFL